jgi:hypothetical protein
MTDIKRDRSLLKDPDHWRRGAVEMRTFAETAQGDARAGFLRIAAEYEQLADRAEKRIDLEP